VKNDISQKSSFIILREKSVKTLQIKYKLLEISRWAIYIFYIKHLENVVRGVLCAESVIESHMYSHIKTF
jgi:hypothetical protein